MDWGSLLTTIFSTIGNVAGTLLGVNSIEEGVITFKHDSVINGEQGFASTFYADGKGGYGLFNQSSSADDYITMTFPATGDKGAQSLIIPGRQSWDVTQFFKENAQEDNSQFQLTASSAAQTNGVGGQQAGVKIAASGRQIPVQGKKQSICAYLDVQAEKQQITVTPKSGIVLQSLPVVIVEGYGDTCFQCMDVQGQGDQIVIQLPQPISEEVISVEVVANAQQASIDRFLAKYQNANGGLVQLDDETIERIRKAPVLNHK